MRQERRITVPKRALGESQQPFRCDRRNIDSGCPDDPFIEFEAKWFINTPRMIQETPFSSYRVVESKVCAS
jgi:hypothetical protein